MKLLHSEAIISFLLGILFQIQTDYAYNNDPVLLPRQLECNFETECCYSNSDTNSGLEWKRASGYPDRETFRQAFGTDTLPRRTYLAAESTRRDDRNTARLVSCEVLCVNDDSDPVLQIRHWTTENAVLEVCLLDAEVSSELYNCEPLPRSSSPGPTRITLPPFFPGRIVITASFNDGPGIALVDDIRASFKLCDNDEESLVENRAVFSPRNSGTRTRPPVNPNARDRNRAVEDPSVSSIQNECDAFTCDFERGYCSYSSPGSLFVRARDTFRNFVTGIRKPSPIGKNHFLGCHLHLGEEGSLISGTMPEGMAAMRKIQFQIYKATNGMLVRGCCDSLNDCPYQSEQKIGGKHIDWHREDFTCPAGTKTIIFDCRSQDNKGTCGIDEIELLDNTGRTICPPS